MTSLICKVCTCLSLTLGSAILCNSLDIFRHFFVIIIKLGAFSKLCILQRLFVVLWFVNDCQIITFFVLLVRKFRNFVIINQPFVCLIVKSIMSTNTSFASVRWVEALIEWSGTFVHQTFSKELCSLFLSHSLEKMSFSRTCDNITKLRLILIHELVLIILIQFFLSLVFLLLLFTHDKFV
jgi:hypothetical protein